MTQRIVGPAKEAYDKLPQRMKNDIDEWLEDQHNRVLYDKNDVLDAWLEWNGIIGYGDQMRSMFEALK